MQHIFYNGWEGFARTLTVGVLGYVFLVGYLCWSGKRTLSKRNAFDLIVTVSLGSVLLASLLLGKSVAPAEGVLTRSLLVALQFVVIWTSVHARRVRRCVTGELLLDHGEFLPAVLKHARVTKDEARAAIHSAGIGSLNQVAAVVLETDGSFSVVKQTGTERNGSGARSADPVSQPRLCSSRSGLRQLSEGGGQQLH